MNIPAFLKNFVRPIDFEAVLIEKTWLNENVLKLMYEVVNVEFNFEAGQFVNLKFMDGDKEIQRAYSIASGPTFEKVGGNGFRFELCVEIIEGGKAGAYFEKIEVSETSMFKGPFGVCTVPNSCKEIVLVGTGTGIAPIKSILEDIDFHGKEVEKINVLFGCRYEKDFFYLDELRKLNHNLVEKGINIKTYLCVTRESEMIVEGLDTFYGRVTSLLDQQSELLNENSHLYICGGSEMIKQVREIGLTNKIDKGNIHVEIFD